MIIASAAVLSVAGAKTLPAATQAPVSHAPVAMVQAPIAAIAALQDAGGAQPTPAQPQTSKGDVKVDINSTTTHSWYADPFWIAIGVIALVVIVLLVAFAGRGGSSTTVVR
jgi:hypothetical protein